MQLVERQSEDAPEQEPEVPVDTELAERAAAVEQAEAERFREVSVRCTQCGSGATVTRTEGGGGFIIIASHGMPHDTTTFGISEAGLPICPNHSEGVGMVPVEAKPIAEAMADAQAQLGDATQQPLWDPPPFDLHFAFAEIIKQQQRVTAKRLTWEDLKKDTKEAKDELDTAAEFLEKMISKAASDEKDAIAAGLRLADPTVGDNPPIEQREKELSELQEIASLRQRTKNPCSCEAGAEQLCPACAAADKLVAMGVTLFEDDVPAQPEYLDTSRIAPEVGTLEDCERKIAASQDEAAELLDKITSGAEPKKRGRKKR